MQKTGRFFIYAPRIHYGGGFSLLADLLQTAPPSTVFLLDQSLKSQLVSPPEHVRWLPSGLPSYFEGERQLRRLLKDATPDDTLLSFSNLPSMLRYRARSIVYLQNLYVLMRPLHRGFRFRTSVRHIFEWAWFRLFAGNCDEVWVQTPSVERRLKKVLPKTLTRVCPFVSSSTLQSSTFEAGERSGFIYVASYEPHKNHNALIEAWVYLAKLNIFPRLALNAHIPPSIQEKVDEARKLGAKIEILKPYTSEERLKIYSSFQALVYPSKLETLGLPLIEAKGAGLDIIASELDFVRDTTQPVESFDPNSSVSIARAIQRYLNVRDYQQTRLLPTTELWSLLKRNSDA